MCRSERINKRDTDLDFTEEVHELRHWKRERLKHAKKINWHDITQRHRSKDRIGSGFCLYPCDIQKLRKHRPDLRNKQPQTYLFLHLNRNSTSDYWSNSSSADRRRPRCTSTPFERSFNDDCRQLFPSRTACCFRRVEVYVTLLPRFVVDDDYFRRIPSRWRTRWGMKIVEVSPFLGRKYQVSI